MASSRKRPVFRVIDGGLTDVSGDPDSEWGYPGSGCDWSSSADAERWARRPPLPHHVPRLGLDENVRLLARPLWGKAMSEWAWCLGRDVVDRIPSSRGRAARGWAAGVLWAAAVEWGMADGDPLADRIVTDILEMTGVSLALARRRWLELQRLGLDRPTNPPVYWSDRPS